MEADNKFDELYSDFVKILGDQYKKLLKFYTNPVYNAKNCNKFWCANLEYNTMDDKCYKYNYSTSNEIVTQRKFKTVKKFNEYMSTKPGIKDIDKIQITFPNDQHVITRRWQLSGDILWAKTDNIIKTKFEKEVSDTIVNSPELMVEIFKKLFNYTDGNIQVLFFETRIVNIKDEPKNLHDKYTLLRIQLIKTFYENDFDKILDPETYKSNKFLYNLMLLKTMGV